jgi:hypothetical protein
MYVDRIYYHISYLFHFIDLYILKRKKFGENA